MGDQVRTKEAKFDTTPKENQPNCRKLLGKVEKVKRVGRKEKNKIKKQKRERECVDMIKKENKGQSCKSPIKTT